MAAAIVEHRCQAELLLEDLNGRRKSDLLWRDAHAHVLGRVAVKEHFGEVGILAVGNDAVLVLVLPAEQRNLPVAADGIILGDARVIRSL